MLCRIGAGQELILDIGAVSVSRRTRHGTSNGPTIVVPDMPIENPPLVIKAYQNERLGQRSPRLPVPRSCRVDQVKCSAYRVDLVGPIVLVTVTFRVHKRVTIQGTADLSMFAIGEIDISRPNTVCCPCSSYEAARVFSLASSSRTWKH